jgi:hypothetical protein
MPVCLSPPVDILVLVDGLCLSNGSCLHTKHLREFLVPLNEDEKTTFPDGPNLCSIVVTTQKNPPAAVVPGPLCLARSDCKANARFLLKEGGIVEMVATRDVMVLDGSEDVIRAAHPVIADNN